MPKDFDGKMRLEDKNVKMFFLAFPIQNLHEWIDHDCRRMRSHPPMHYGRKGFLHCLTEKL